MGRRALGELAVHNAVEGCVGESLGAMLAAHGAAHAADDHVARVLAPIAVDEAQHAALSFAVADWLTPRLTYAERARVTEAVTAAVAAGVTEVRLSAADRRRAGVAEADRVRGWVRHLGPTLWAEAVG